jgi:hypothetical protein
MSTGAPDPLIHDPQRLRIVATLAALPDGDTLSVTRLQDMIRLPPGGLITCLRELDRSGRNSVGYRNCLIPGPVRGSGGQGVCPVPAELMQFSADLAHPLVVSVDRA